MPCWQRSSQAQRRVIGIWSLVVGFWPPNYQRPMTNHGLPAVCCSRVPHPEVIKCRLGTSLPLHHPGISDIADVLHAHLAREKSARREIAHAVEELHARAHLRLRLGGPRDLVEHRAALGVRTDRKS